MSGHEKINYVELPANNLAAAKQFYGQVFGWVFADYGPDYVAFANSGLDGGFYRSAKQSSVAAGAALIVLYSKDLQQTETKILAAGGTIVKPVFTFPGGRRFHFADPNGNELAVWSEQ
ncbi:putative enzyme related to lactoylglutathione lyase [Rheinheimera pacifica]|uniref:VOC family protein n=1 Tax=Rheinheimera pacifica TaxID=173990 RepID=UPI000CAE5C29|nr:VOC family protein [Rheinheimera pacifica]MDR6984675.1 putative enzyme related to lactoylglutathione lyase [Rheinheimera pacifica]PKM20765.1 MAG: glyoxalase [Gammaproteobacteria bacterium HGW-Gammaproteobacteria-15]